MNKFLIVGPAWVGDMVMAQTFFKLLRTQNPTSQIDVVAPPATAPLISRMPEINNLWPIPAKHGEFGWSYRYKLGRELHAQHYNQAFILQNSWKSALVPFIARIPKRTSWLGEHRWGLINDIHHLDPLALPLMIQRFACLAFPRDTNWHEFGAQYNLSTLPWPELVVQPSQRAEVLQKFNILPSEQPILALCPGAEFGPAKRWPAEYYAEVANNYLNQGWAVWLFGSPKEQDAADLIMSETHDRCMSFVGKTKLVEAIDLMSQVSAIVTNDSGLMHIAAALGKPVIVVYGSSSPKFTPPLSHQAQILSLNLSCSPCFQRECPLGHLRCLKDLLPAQVVSAVNSNSRRI
ncbi:MAG: lipopolysaccharide heptosyltransferase II [Gammaproteobacteria bacterium]